MEHSFASLFLPVIGRLASLQELAQHRSETVHQPRNQKRNDLCSQQYCMRKPLPANSTRVLTSWQAFIHVRDQLLGHISKGH